MNACFGRKPRMKTDVHGFLDQGKENNKHLTSNLLPHQAPLPDPFPSPLILAYQALLLVLAFPNHRDHQNRSRLCSYAVAGFRTPLGREIEVHYKISIYKLIRNYSSSFLTKDPLIS
jgi:hypothetical protein